MKRLIFLILLVLVTGFATIAFGRSDAFKGNIYNPGVLKARDSAPKLKVGDKAPDFSLPALNGERVSLQQ